MSKRFVMIGDLPVAMQKLVRKKIGRPPKNEALAELRRKQAKLRDEEFRKVLARRGLPDPVAEYKFDADRRWRFDYAWPSFKIALEVEGGVWSGGRHTRGSGFVGDMDKYNSAAVQGWRVLRVTPDNLSKLSTETALRRMLKANVSG